MKKIITIALVLFGVMVQAQNKLGKNDDLSRISLAAFVPEQTESVPLIAKKLLTSKVERVITGNGLASTGFYSRFVVVPEIEVLTKDITPTAPAMTALTLSVTFHVGDGFEGQKFSSTNIEVKGVGTNETKAYVSAIKQIKTNSKNMQDMIARGKERIIEYYNSNCDFLITRAKTLKSQKKYDEAIFLLNSVPSVCKECFDKSNNLIGEVFDEKINFECKTKLSRANSIWVSSQNIEGAEEAGELLASIDPSSSCFSQVESLYKKISNKVKELNDREWNYVLKTQKQESERIQAMKEIGVAFGKNQPDTVYKTEYISRW